MNFNEFLNQAWSDHAHKTDAVAARIPDAFPLLQDGAQVASLAHLITHVFGEHLGDWGAGLALLDTLAINKLVCEESRAAINRSVAALRLAQNDAAVPEAFSLSDQVRIYSMAAAARAHHGDVRGAEKMFSEAERISEFLLKSDPAHRAVAITANNLASGLEETADRTTEQTEIMVRAASIALEKWQVAGGPVQVQTANYRMAKSLIQAGRFDEAMGFALACHRIGVENSAGPIDMFYAHEVLAQVARKLTRADVYEAESKNAAECFKRLSDSDKEWARADFEKLRVN